MYPFSVFGFDDDMTAIDKISKSEGLPDRCLPTLVLSLVPSNDRLFVKRGAQFNRRARVACQCNCNFAYPSNDCMFVVYSMYIYMKEYASDQSRI